MIVLIGETCSAKNIATLKENGWGRMFVVRRPSPFPYEPWGFDNQAFKAWQDGTPWDEANFLRRLEVAQSVNSDPYLAVTPDIVAAGCTSLHFSTAWRMRLRDVEFPWYLAVQDGMTVADVEPLLHLYDGIFLGGSDKFKPTAWRWCALAHKYQLKFHYGRASTPSKLVSAYKIGADSCDSSFPLWTTDRMKTFVWRWQGLSHQQTLEYV